MSKKRLDGSAAADITGDSIPNGGYRSASFHCQWANLDAADGVFKVQVRNHESLEWVDKTGGELETGVGVGPFSDVINLSNVCNEEFYRIIWEHGANSAGTVKCYSTQRGEENS